MNMLGRVKTRVNGYKQLRTNNRGDTIIEVLVSITVLSLALAICYNLANKSLRTGISATNRAEASAINQGQVELLKNARASLSSTEFNNTFTTMGGSTSFCFMVPSSPSIIGAYYKTTASTCKINPASLYTTKVNYGLDGAGVFTVNTSWDSLSGTGTDQLTIYYKVQQ